MLVLLLQMNLTDWIVDAFGIDVMNALWAPLMTLFDVLEAFFHIDLTPLWERLFS